MRLRCPNCNEPIPAASINVEQTLAVCPNCDEVFNFANRISTRKLKPTERKIKPPEHVQVIETEQGVRIAHDMLPADGLRRVASQVAGLLVAVLGAIIIIGCLVWGSKVSGGLVVSYLVLVALLGLPLLLAGLSRVFNKRYAELDQDTLRSYSRPIPSLGKRFDRNRVVGFTVRESQQMLFFYYFIMFKQGYDIDVKLSDGSQRRFLGGVNTEYAQFIAQELNHALKDSEALDDELFNQLEDEETTTVEDIVPELKQKRQTSH